MHPNLLNNSHFLRYYNAWQANPASIVFAPIAEYLQIYGMVDDAIKVCLEGLKHHPRLVSGRLALAKAYLRKKETARAKEQLQFVLKIVPKQEKALELLNSLEKTVLPVRPAVSVIDTALPLEGATQAPKKKSVSWETVTMAKIYAQQGHIDRAREVYQAILKKEPAHADALQGLAGLAKAGVESEA